MKVYIVGIWEPGEGCSINAIYLDKALAEEAASVSSWLSAEEFETTDQLPIRFTEYSMAVMNIELLGHPDDLEQIVVTENATWEWPWDMEPDKLIVMANLDRCSLLVRGRDLKEVKEAFMLKLREMQEELPKFRQQQSEERANRIRTLTDEGLT